MNSQTPTARLVKIIRRNETVRVSNVVKHNGEFTKSPLETLSHSLDILLSGSQQTENHATGNNLVDNPFMRPRGVFRGGPLGLAPSLCKLSRSFEHTNDQARSQKFAMGGYFGGQWGSGVEALTCRRLGVWEQSLKKFRFIVANNPTVVAIAIDS